MECVHLGLPKQARQSQVKKMLPECKGKTSPQCIALALEFLQLLAGRKPCSNLQKSLENSAKLIFNSPPQTQKNPGRVWANFTEHPEPKI